ncbi:MAG: hypothetical protein GXN93_01800 [Candidatus Diapherotrites archaeon]|nr:hypothetical protein [Candidatus Diapherotrites archaeon]
MDEIKRESPREREKNELEDWKKTKIRYLKEDLLKTTQEPDEFADKVKKFFNDHEDMFQAQKEKVKLTDKIFRKLGRIKKYPKEKEQYEWLKKEYRKRLEIIKNLEKWDPEPIAILGEILYKHPDLQERLEEIKRTYEDAEGNRIHWFYPYLKKDIKERAKYPTVYIHAHNGDEMLLIKPIFGDFGEWHNIDSIHILLSRENLEKMTEKEIAKKALDMLEEYFGKYGKMTVALGWKHDPELVDAIYIKHGVDRELWVPGKPLPSNKLAENLRKILESRKRTWSK